MMLKRPCSFSARGFSAHHISVQLCEVTPNLNLELSAAQRSRSHCSTASSSPPISISSPFPNNSLIELMARYAPSIACPTTHYGVLFWFFLLVFCHFSEVHHFLCPQTASGQAQEQRQEDSPLLLWAGKGLMLNWAFTRDPSCRVF